MYCNKSKFILLVILFLFLATWSGMTNDTIINQTSKADISKLDTIKADTSSVIRIKHSPNRAALLSAVFPGLGQIYNHKYWKLPIIYTAFGISTYYFITNQKQFKLYLQGFVDLSNNPTDYNSVKDLELLKGLTNEQKAYGAQYYMELYRRWRDWSVFALAGFYVLNIIDATVDAYFFDYDISEDLTMKVEPVLMNSLVNRQPGALGLKLTFNLR